jgi:hypothetical protein
MSETEASQVDHRRLGVDLYNATWALLDRDDRTAEDDDAMISAAHASMHHWSQVDGVRPENLGRGHWLCSRVHAVMAQPDAAAYHADRYVTIAESQPVADWDLAAALEASARAAAIAGDWDAAEDFVTRARRACASIAEDDDRAVIESDLATVPRRP